MGAGELFVSLFWITIGLVTIIVGMRFLVDGLDQVAGTHFAKLLESVTATPERAFFAGTLAAASLQSSSTVTLATVALVQAKALTLAAATGVVLGANVGTTVTAQLMAFPVARLWAIPLFLGAGADLLWRRPWGRALVGIGLCFLGLFLLEKSAAPLASAPLVEKALREAENPVQGAVLGVILTALAQSSTAVTALLIVLARSGLISLPAAIAVNLGANVGTCVTSLIAGSRTGTAGMRVALTHFAFNLTGALTFLPLVQPFANLVALLSADPARQVAHAHALFNVVTALAALPLSKWWASFLLRRTGGS